MAKQILVGADAHQAALELLKAGHLDSNPVALADGAFEVSLKPELSDEFHAAGVQKLLNGPVNVARYYKMILQGPRAHDMAQNEYLKTPSIFGRKPQDITQGLVFVDRIRVYGLQDRLNPITSKVFVTT
jgi:hypothetical protein